MPINKIQYVTHADTEGLRSQSSCLTPVRMPSLGNKPRGKLLRRRDPHTLLVGLETGGEGPQTAVRTSIWLSYAACRFMYTGL